MSANPASVSLRITGLLALLAMLGLFVPGYHLALQQSIRNHPEATQRVLQEHCRYLLGQQLGKLSGLEVAERLRRCGDLRVKSVDAAGGVFDPVYVRIVMEPPPQPVVDPQVFIFKSASVYSRGWDFGASLSCLLRGKWEFNPFTTYSEFSFKTSF